ncbi:MAG: hypothetical protein WCZ90_17355, partial [Melioribacteraceae bacterium]
MKKNIAVVLLLLVTAVYAQHENVPLDNDVYTFLKEMKVKGIISGIHDDSPNMSRYEIKNLLSEISATENLLSRTELTLLNKYREEFVDNENASNGDQSSTETTVVEKSFPD